MGEAFANTAESGPLLLAVLVCAVAGLVSFLSPCVLPLVPGYLSYVTGLTGADLDSRTRDSRTRDPRTGDRIFPENAVAGGLRTRTFPENAVGRQGRVLAGTLLFIAGFSAVFITTGVVAAAIGQSLQRHARAVEIVVGALIVVLGLAFLGLIPGLQREFRVHRLPAAGLLGAPVFGAVFALSWIPCVGPTLGAVLGLATTGGDTGRAVVLAAAYCVGIGLPFVAFGLGFRRLAGVFTVVRRNSRWVTRVGGAMLILVGLALVTGGWGDFTIWLRTTFGAGEVSI
jgi:cytochrome c-type biogenesis protein